MLKQSQNLTQSSVSRSVMLCLFLVASVLLGSCGGNVSDGGEPSPTWVRIDQPTDGDATGESTVLVKGNAAVNRVDPITWTTSNGTSGQVTQQTICILACLTAFEATVPLALGTNVITIRLSDGASASVTVSRYPLVKALGKVVMATGAYVPDVTVSLSGSSSATTRTYGEFSFSNLREGSYSVAPSLVLAPPQSTECLSFSPSSRNFTVTASSSEDIRGLDFVASQLMPCYRVSGVILESTFPDIVGRPDTKVVLKNGSGNEYVVYSGSGGYYAFIYLPPGTYTVTPIGATFDPPVSTVTVTNADVSLPSIGVLK